MRISPKVGHVQNMQRHRAYKLILRLLLIPFRKQRNKCVFIMTNIARKKAKLRSLQYTCLILQLICNIFSPQLIIPKYRLILKILSRLPPHNIITRLTQREILKK